MFIPEAGFVDRVEQSIILLKNNFLTLCQGLIVYNVIFLILIPTVFWQFIPLEAILSGDMSSKTSIIVSLAASLGLVYGVTYAIFLIPIYVSILRRIRNILNKAESGNTNESMYNGLTSLGKAFATYWYIFSYVYLIPALIFIVGGLLFVGLTFMELPLDSVGIILSFFLMGVSVLVFLVFMFYRGTKAAFGISSAIDTEEFTKKNLHDSLEISDGKWWRLFGNLFGIGFIIGACGNLLKAIGGIFVGLSYDWTTALSNLDTDNPEATIQEVMAIFSEFNVISFINSLIQTFFTTIFTVLVLVFIYRLFRRFQYEFSQGSSLPLHSQENLTIKKEL